MNRNGWYRSLLVGLLLVAVMDGMTGTASAQGYLALDDIDATAFPRMRGRVFVGDDVGNQFKNLTPGDFVLTENGVVRQITLIDCPVVQEPVPLSSVLTIDISGSMSGRNIEIARAAATAWVQALALGNSECAVTTFDDGAYVNRDFSTSRSALLTTISAIGSGGGTNYGAGFIDAHGGGVTIAARGAHKRVLIFLTDGMGGGNEDAIVQAALNGSVTIYCIALGMTAPSVLQNVAARTGGRCFERVRTREEAEEIYRTILFREQNLSACSIEWTSGPECEPDRHVALSLPSKGLAVGASYVAPATSVSELGISPSSLAFGGVPPGTTDTRIVTVTARNLPVTITGISSNDPRATIIAGAVPPTVTLAPGMSHKFTVQFAPTDSGLVFARIDIASDACLGRYLYLSGGYPGKRPAKPTLRLVGPNGGEKFVVGADTAIEWVGVLPEDSVKLDYSTDGGGSWLPIAAAATGLRYPWRTPNTPSGRCLARVSQLGGESGDSILVLRVSRGEIHTVAFAPEDAVVATGMAGAVILWDARSGKPIDTFSLAYAVDPLFAFSPDGASLMAYVVADFVPQVTIWNLATGTVDLKIAAGQVIALAYDRTGARIATAVSEGNGYVVKIWDATTGVLLTSFDCLDKVVSLDFSPDGELLATAGGSTPRVWEISSKNLVRSMVGHGGRVNSVQFSPDGSMVLSGSDDRTAIIWNALSGTELLTLKGHIDRVYAASFSPDGTRILTTSADGTAKIWDSGDGALMQTLTGHTSLVFGGVWSHFGDRVMTGSGDQTARIWDLAPGALQRDLSDSLWEIVRPIVEASDLEFGDVALGGTADSIVVGYLCNRTSVPVEIDSLGWAGAHPQDFSLVSGAPPLTIPPDTCIAVEFRFSPGDVGRRSALVRIVTPFDTLERTIGGNGVRSELEIASTVVDFGVVPLGEFRDTTVSVVIRNVGASPVTIDDVELRGPDSLNFAIGAGGGAFGLAPGDVHSMKLRFTPEWRGRTTGRLFFRHAGVGSPEVVYLYGEGTCGAEVGTSTITLAEAGMGVAPGEIVTVPLMLSEASDLFTSGGKFTGTLRYDRTVILPLDTGITVADGSDGEQIITFGGAWDGTSDTLAVLHFMTALGDADTTRLTIDAFVWESDCPIDVKRVDGVVRVDVCRDGGRSRLFFADGRIALKPSRPNPAKGTVEMEYSLIEAGPMRLSLVDAAGQTVRVIREGASAPGDYAVSVDLSGLPTGQYFCLLETPTRRLVRALRIEN